MPTEFDIRLRRYTPGGARGGILRSQTISATLPIDDPPYARVAVSERVYGALPDVLEVALEYWSAGAWHEAPNGRFLVNTDDDDDKDPAKIHNIQGVGFIPWLLTKCLVESTEDPDDLVDGHRPFNSATPGAILKTIVDENQALGWASYVSIDFDADNDSNGDPWESQITISYAPGTKASVVLKNLLDQGLAEYVTEGRVLRLFNPGRGEDLSVGASPVRVGRKGESLKSKRSLDDLITDVNLYGDNGAFLSVNNPSAVTALGRLAAAIKQGGVSDPGTMELLSQAELKQGESIRQQLTATEFAASASSLPWVHYQVGDTVGAWFRSAWNSYRVPEVVVDRSENGTVTVSAVLNDRFIELLARLARRTAGIVGGAVAGGTGAVPSAPGDDRRKPKAPVGLVVSSTGYWWEGTPLSQVAAEWTAVTQGEDSVAIEVQGYELWGRRDDGAMESGVVTSTTGTNATWSPFDPLSPWLFKVRAQSKNGVWGDFSDEVAVTMQYPDFALEVPTPPSLSSENGVVVVVWDGLFDTDPASLPPTNFREMRVEMGVTETDEFDLVGVLRVGSQRQPLTDLGVGSTWSFRFRPVDRLGRIGEPSEVRTITVVGIDGADLLADTVDANALRVGSVTARVIAADVSGVIDLTATVGYEVVIGQITDVADDLSGTAASLAATQTRYSYGPDGQVISAPGQSTSVRVAAGVIQMKDGTLVQAEWVGGEMRVPSILTEHLGLPRHKIESGASGTVFRHVT